MWSDANTPKETKVVRRCQVMPTVNRPDLIRDVEFRESRYELDRERAAREEDEKKAEQMSTPSDFGDSIEFPENGVETAKWYGGMPSDWCSSDERYWRDQGKREDSEEDAAMPRQ
jgi:hypothetical protein